jgi:hypothetical protein
MFSVLKEEAFSKCYLGGSVLKYSAHGFLIQLFSPKLEFQLSYLLAWKASYLPYVSFSLPIKWK